MRVKITMSYNGTNFLGSQIQKETTNTIFGNFEAVLKSIGIMQKPQASGRTDKGVHASGQVCHLDLPEFWKDLKKLQKVLNQKLPKSINIKSIQEVRSDFHARYSAKKRVYRYIIKDSVSNPFEHDFITFLAKLDYQKIQKNIKLFVGEYDFINFMKLGSDSKTTIRIIYRAFAYRYKDYIILNFEANGFLRSQIRLMVGAILQLDNTKIKQQLRGENKYKIKPAPANGLYLAKIKY